MSVALYFFFMFFNFVVSFLFWGAWPVLAEAFVADASSGRALKTKKNRTKQQQIKLQLVAGVFGLCQRTPQGLMPVLAGRKFKPSVRLGDRHRPA